MAAPVTPKYQAIYAVLRGRILDGDYPAGSKLPSQQELAESFTVTLMTLRQALSALESDGLVRAERGKGTFVADRPIDIKLGNLSSFAQQMQSVGIDLVTEVLDVATLAVGSNPAADAALGTEGELLRITRRRSVGTTALSLQRSYLDPSSDVANPDTGFNHESLYGAIEAATGSVIAEADESMTAVALSADDAALLDVQAGYPAILSIRTSINQFRHPFLYDEALLVGDRCTIHAHRTSDRLAMQYDLSAD